MLYFKFVIRIEFSSVQPEMFRNFKYIFLLSFSLTFCKKYLIETDDNAKTTPSGKHFRSMRRVADGKIIIYQWKTPSIL